MPTRESTPAHWDRVWQSHGFANARPVFLQALRAGFSLQGKRALEVGAGTGTSSSRVAADGANVIALDYSAESVQLIQRTWAAKFPSLAPLRADAVALPFADSSFDLVFHDGVIEHFADPHQFLKENWRVMRPGGMLVVGVPQKYNPFTLYKQALILFNRWPYGWETQYSVGELRAFLEQTGFQVAQTFADGVIGTFGPRSVRLAQRLSRWLRLSPGRNGPGAAHFSPPAEAGEALIFRLSQVPFLSQISFSVVMTGIKPGRTS